MRNERVGVVVVNWNDPEATAACLESIVADARDLVVPVCVDNGSATDPGPYVTARVRQAHMVRLSANVGYAAGCNAGARKALELGATHLLLLNNDLVVEPGAIAALLEASRHLPDSILAPMVVYADRPDIVWAAGAGVSRPWMHNWHIGEGESRLSIDGGKVDWAPGCALFVTRRAWSVIGPLDESYFLYLEDLDWCLRARLRNVATHCVASAVVRHSGSLTANRSLTRAAVHYYGCRNTHRIAWKHNRGAMRALVGITAAWSVIKGRAHAALLPSLRHDPLHRARLRALSDFLNGVRGESALDRPSMPRSSHAGELSSRPR